MLFETENFITDINEGDKERLIISISSLGYCRNEKYHQFWKTINNTGSTAMFVADKKGHWFNHKESEDVFQKISDFCGKFKNVAVMGDSMGGSGAILISNYIANLSRVLAFAPQYSLSRPFIDFDLRYLRYAKDISGLYFDNYADSPIKEKCVLLYGNKNWRDQVHRGMFERVGFSTMTVDGAPHEVAIHLRNQDGDKLQPLANALADFDRPFDQKAVAAVLGDYHVESPRIANSAVAPAEQSRPVFETPKSPQRDRVDIAQGRPARQSSIGKWSKGKSVEEDAALALTGQVMEPYACHTLTEVNPWWSVELGQLSEIEEIEIYNRTENEKIMGRMSQILIETRSGQGADWVRRFVKISRSVVGDKSGAPFTWRPAESIVATELRITILGFQCLHFKKVAVYGKAVPAPA